MTTLNGPLVYLIVFLAHSIGLQLADPDGGFRSCHNEATCLGFAL